MYTVDGVMTLQMVRAGQAAVTGRLKPDDRGHVYVIVDRYDVQRTDHYREPKAK